LKCSKPHPRNIAKATPPAKPINNPSRKELMELIYSPPFCFEKTGDPPAKEREVYSRKGIYSLSKGLIFHCLIFVLPLLEAEIFC